MTLIDLSAPICLATVIAVGWAIIAYYLHLRDKSAGLKASAILLAWLSFPAPCILAFLFIEGKNGILDTPFEIMMGGLLGIAMGGTLLFCVGMAFFNTSASKGERNAAMLYSLFLAALFLAPLFF